MRAAAGRSGPSGGPPLGASEDEAMGAGNGGLGAAAFSTPFTAPT